MLDLNVEIIATDSSPTYNDNSKSLMIMEEDVGPKLLEEDDDNEEEEEEDAEQSSAGTSNSSSVVNADDPPPNAGDENTSSPLIFGIIKKESGTLSPDLVTRQLFPAVGEGSELGFGAQSLTSKPQWLNLSFGGGDSGGAPAAGGVPELRILQQKQQQQQQQQVRKSRRGPRSRSSQYRGVTFYRRTGRWESHIWDCGKQVYLGGFDTAYAAARAYDRAAIKFRGVDADINFNIGDYDEDMKQMGNLTKEEFVHILRRQSTGFSRGSSKFRGVSLHKCGPWDARVGQFLGKKPHDKAAVPYNGREAMTNFKPGTYEGEIILDVGSGGRAGHNLDLNLGISLLSSGSKEARSGGEVDLYYADGEMPSREVTMGDCSFPASKRPPIWSAMYPFLLPNSEGKATEKRAAEGNPKSGWKMQFGNSGGIDGSAPLLMPVVFPHAASSGFSASLSSSSTTPAPHLQRNAVLHGPNPSLHAIAKPASSSSFPYLSFRN